MKKIKNNSHTKGYTLIEIMISIAIFTGIIGLVAAFQNDIFSLNKFIQSGLKNQVEAKNLIKNFTTEVRSASVSEQGAYPIKLADNDTFIFYSDIDFDSVKEEIRYFIEDNTLKKGVIEPRLNPVEYRAGDEKIYNVVNHVQNKEPFKYFDGNYKGGVDDYLKEPFMISEIRMVSVDLIIDSNPGEPPQAFEIGTKINIRNLREK